MMGSKKPADYRNELLGQFRKEGVSPLRWLEEQIRKHRQGSSETIRETLDLLRQGLRRALQEEKKRRKRTKTSSRPSSR